MNCSDTEKKGVTPAEAGAHLSVFVRAGRWIPVFAGMTSLINGTNFSYRG